MTLDVLFLKTDGNKNNMKRVILISMSKGVSNNVIYLMFEPYYQVWICSICLWYSLFWAGKISQ